jgi:hypothetical protein
MVVSSRLKYFDFHLPLTMGPSVYFIEAIDPNFHSMEKKDKFGVCLHNIKFCASN